MSRLIDADEFEVVTAKVPKDMDAKSYMAGMEYVLSQIDALPTIEERKTWKWIEKDIFYIDDADDKNVIDAWQSAKCSVCGKYHTTPYLYSFDNFNYCPNCGSAMTEGEQP